MKLTDMTIREESLAENLLSDDLAEQVIFDKDFDMFTMYENTLTEEYYRSLNEEEF